MAFSTRTFGLLAGLGAAVAAVAVGARAKSSAGDTSTVLQLVGSENPRNQTQAFAASGVAHVQELTARQSRTSSIRVSSQALQSLSSTGSPPHGSGLGFTRAQSSHSPSCQVPTGDAPSPFRGAGVEPPTHVPAAPPEPRTFLELFSETLGRGAAFNQSDFFDNWTARDNLAPRTSAPPRGSCMSPLEAPNPIPTT